MPTYQYQRELTGGCWDIDNPTRIDVDDNQIKLAKEVEEALPGWSFLIRCDGATCDVLADEDCPNEPLLSSTVAAHKAGGRVGSVAAYIGRRVAEVDAITSEYLHTKYAAHDLDFWNGLYAEAVDQGLSSRAAYIRSLLTWATSISTSYYGPKATAIAGCSTFAEVDAITFSLEDCAATMDPTDPDVSLAAALSIPD